MQITALIQVINYLKEKSGDTVLLEGYKTLAEMFRETSKNAEAGFSPAILKEKDQLRQSLLESDPVNWGYASYSLFEKMNSNHLFGKVAADYLDNLISADNKDYQVIYNDLSKKIKLISKLSDTLTRFQQMFEQVVPAEIFQSAADKDNKASLFLYFEGPLSVQNIADLERYSRLWDGILSSFYKLTAEENLSLDINSFSNGEVVLGVATEAKTLNAIMEGVVGMVTPLPMILKIRKIQIEMALLPLYNDMNQLLEEEIKSLVNNTALKTAQKLTSDYCSNVSYGDEMVKDLSPILKQILSFIEKGGKIEFNPLPSKPEMAQTNKLLIESFIISRELERLAETLEKALSGKDALVNVME
jgi:hypothetical protein